MERLLRYLSVLFIVIFISTSLSAQKLTIKLADNAYHEFNWIEAIDLYTYVYEKDNENVYVMRKLADCYTNIRDYKEVEKWLAAIIDMGEDQPEDWYSYYMALKSNAKYNEAQEALEIFAELMPEDERVDLQQSILEYINFLYKDSTKYVINNVSFNSSGADWGPTIYKDKIVYVSTGNPEDSRNPKYNWDQLPFLDIYAVDVLEDGSFSEPDTYADDINTSFHDGPVAFDNNTKRMYFNSNRSSKNAKRKEVANNLQIFYAEFEDDEWVYKGDFEHNNPKDNYQHPSIDASGTEFYFSSDRPGGKGGNDIWYCLKEGEEWGEPINLSAINTKGNEVFPFIGEDGVLYFSSDGLAGIGELDIYMALPENGEFVTYENLGYPVNSASSDFGIVLDKAGLNGFFASDRAGGKGYDDIYELEILHIPIQIVGVVKDRISAYEIAGAQVVLLDENRDTVFADLTNDNGRFAFTASKQHNYKLVVNFDNYTPYERDISTFNKLPNEVIELNLNIEMFFDLMAEPDQLEPLSIEFIGNSELQIIQIEHINYAFDSDVILDEAAMILNQVIELVSQYPDLSIMVESHTDAKGSDDYNLRLSQRRAASAYKFLVAMGIDKERVTYSGYGETRLLNHCEDGVECVELEHSINRRSIIKVVRKGKYTPKKNSRSLFYF